MKENRTQQGTRTAPAGEPVGIVISRGREPETIPVFAAYMYAPDPGAGAAAAGVLAGA